VKLGGVTVELIEVAGHASMMFAVRVGEVLFAADALFGPDVLSKHPLTFCMDSALMKDSAARLGQEAGVRIVLPGHGEPTEDLPGLVATNLTAHERVTRAVEAACADPASTDEVLRRVCAALGVVMTGAAAVVLNRSVVSAHLVELVEAGRVEMTVRDNLLVYGAVTSGGPSQG
jgi:glyoxylase-like metal-dependent hydrolase (beta-lactamase superfamily II)